MTEIIEVLVKKLLNFVELPKYATTGSAGMDLYAAIENEIQIAPLERKLIPTGISIALPSGYEGQIRSRSGLALKFGIMVLNSPGTIDSDYRGEVCVLLVNLGKEDFVVSRGSRVAQMILAKHETVEWKVCEKLPDSVRNEKGLGSTGY